jgi:ribonuclease HI
MEKFIAYTDGSAYLKDHTGGVGIHFNYPNNTNIELKEGHKGPNVTNQRMELLACIRAIEHCIEYGETNGKKWELEIVSDSMYTINTVTKWAPNWIKVGWKRIVGKKVKDNLENLDLIKPLYQMSCEYKVQYRHVKAHKKEPLDKTTQQWKDWYGNQRADSLANDARNHNSHIAGC